ncbi:MAG: hypothetical protein DRQ49_02660 [Gammaproteobacteria bacterium]|nr:MAG: hypothetical protein DRQ49_02660 [Gammaproteobacteria bacterium]
MTSKKFLIIFGTLLSFVLLFIVFSTLDWQAFLTALKTIRLTKVLLAGGIIIIVIALRSLRWTLVTRMPLAEFKHFWQAVNIGYLGNMILSGTGGRGVASRCYSSFCIVKTRACCIKCSD